MTILIYPTNTDASSINSRPPIVRDVAFAAGINAHGDFPGEAHQSTAYGVMATGSGKLNL